VACSSSEAARKARRTERSRQRRRIDDDDEDEDVCNFERARAFFFSVSADILNARREGSGHPWGRAAAQKLSPITCHSPPPPHRVRPSTRLYRPSACAHTHELMSMRQASAPRRQGFLLFASLLFILLHQKKPSFAPGPLPPRSLKPAASATREILMAQSQGRGTRRDLSGPGAAPAESMLFARCCSSSLP
jgi:hypothetical protein